MKRFLTLYILLFIGAGHVVAQDSLENDQNPAYMNSLVKYSAASDSLLASQGTTVQQTYKAYDWYQAREERRALRRERRHQERLNNPYYYDYWFPSIGYSYGFNNWGWYPYHNGYSSRFWIGF